MDKDSKCNSAWLQWECINKTKRLIIFKPEQNININYHSAHLWHHCSPCCTSNTIAQVTAQDYSTNAIYSTSHRQSLQRSPGIFHAKTGKQKENIRHKLNEATNTPISLNKKISDVRWANRIVPTSNTKLHNILQTQKTTTKTTKKP